MSHQFKTSIVTLVLHWLGMKTMIVGMDDFLHDTHAMEGMLLNEIQQDELGNDANILVVFFEILKTTSIAPLFGYGSRFIQLGPIIFLNNLKAMYGMEN